MTSLKEQVCKAHRITMDKFLANELNPMKVRHFLNHVARCDNCLDYILREKGIEVKS